MVKQYLSLYGYYSFLAVGALSMVILTVLRRRQYHLSAIAAVVFPLFLLVSGVCGAKLLYFIESGMESFEGMSFFGAVYLVMLLMPIVGFLFRLKPVQTLDACAPCVASIIGFMRFGCFCAGCCGGMICTIGVNTFRWPTQLMEGFGDMLILAVLLYYEQQGLKNGLLYPFFLITYGIMRFFIEFLRDTPKTLLHLSEGQYLAILGVLIGIVWTVVARRAKEQHGNNT